MKGLWGIGLVAAGLIGLFAGSQIASTEEGIANSVGNLLQNTWVAIGLVLAGGFLLYSATGHFKRFSA